MGEPTKAQAAGQWLLPGQGWTPGSPCSPASLLWIGGGLLHCTVSPGLQVSRTVSFILAATGDKGQRIWVQSKGARALRLLGEARRLLADFVVTPSLGSSLINGQ